MAESFAASLILSIFSWLALGLDPEIWIPVMNKCSGFRRINPHLGIEELSVENAVSKAFHKILQHELDPIWHQVPAIGTRLAILQFHFASASTCVPHFSFSWFCCLSYLGCYQFSVCLISAVVSFPRVTTRLSSMCSVFLCSCSIDNVSHFWLFLNCHTYLYHFRVINFQSIVTAVFSLICVGLGGL